MAKPTELEIARARVAELEAERDQTIKDFGKLEGRYEQSSNREAQLHKENAGLRDELHASEIRCAELQGYIKALSDTEPPQMVPSPVSRHVEYLMRGEQGNPNPYSSFDRQEHCQWWNRGRR